LKPDRLACQFLHEVFHALVWYFETTKNDQMPEEAAANAASYGLTMFWRDNPEALDWYLELIGDCHRVPD